MGRLHSDNGLALGSLIAILLREEGWAQKLSDYAKWLGPMCAAGVVGIIAGEASAGSGNLPMVSAGISLVTFFLREPDRDLPDGAWYLYSIPGAGPSGGSLRWTVQLRLICFPE